MKLLYRKTWIAVSLALGIAMAGNVTAEPLAGLGLQYKYISPLSFITFTGDCSNGEYDALAASCTSNLTLVNYYAPVDLPEGAQIQRLHYWYKDNSANGNLFIQLEGRSLDFTASNVNQAFTTYGQTTFNSSAVGTASFIRMATMNLATPIVANSWATGVNSPWAHSDYWMRAQLPNGDFSVLLLGVLVAYNRQIAPAPATASFTDIPTSHPFFNEVEQLKKSGITLGCGNGQYCPDSPVTRGQMAAFLSRAFGLQWSPPV